MEHLHPMRRLLDYVRGLRPDCVRGLPLDCVERLRLDSLHALCSCLHGGVVVVVVAHAHKEPEPLSVEGRADAMRMTRLYAGFELELNTQIPLSQNLVN